MPSPGLLGLSQGLALRCWKHMMVLGTKVCGSAPPSRQAARLPCLIETLCWRRLEPQDLSSKELNKSTDLWTWHQTIPKHFQSRLET